MKSEIDFPSRKTNFSENLMDVVEIERKSTTANIKMPE